MDKYIIIRFWVKVKQTDYCWEWEGSRNKDGYGTFKIGNDVVLAHRFAYQYIYGKTPKQVMHKCDNPPCVNPDHLFSGTQFDNMRDKQLKGRARKMIGVSSKYNGVSWRSDSRKWRAIVRTDGKYIHFGSHKTEEEAAVAYNDGVMELFGEECRNLVNVIPKSPND